MAQRVRKGLANWLTGSRTPIFVLDHRGVVLVFNQGAVDLTGRQASEIIGKTCQRITNPNPELIESLTGALIPPQRVFAGEPANVPAVITTSEGSQAVEISFFPLPQTKSDSQFRIMGVIGPLKDSGIELVPESEVRRFDLAELLNKLYQEHRLESLIAASPAMKRVARQVDIARSHLHPVHIIGEKGTGKEYLARLIHYSSSNDTNQTVTKRFVPLDCKKLTHFEISRTLRRLFAETIEDNQVGTVYLQKVEHLAQDLQTELLEHLEGASLFRWISSSTAGVQSASKENFSSELKEIVTAFQIQVPALRERAEDLFLLATYFLERFNHEYEKNIEQFSTELEAGLLAYHWPGNVSELLMVVREIVQTCQENTARAEHLNIEFKAGRDAQRTRPIRTDECLEDFLKRVERERIAEVLEITQGNKMAAAEILQITRAKLYRRIETLGIEANND